MTIQNLNITADKIKEIKIELCKRSFYFFVQSFWHLAVTQDPIWNWHIKEICDLLQHVAIRVKNHQQVEYDYYIINIPPGSSKSTIISIMYPLWCWAIDPKQRFICGSHSSKVSEDLAEKAQKIFISEQYREWFPYVGIDKDAKTHLKNSKGGERYTTSVGAGITGIHADQNIIDDAIDPAKSSSEVERDTANKWITQTLSTRKVDKSWSATILVMQRLHEIDPTGFLLSKKGLRIKHVCLPGELTDNIKPVEWAKFYVNGLFDPVRLTRQNLDLLKAELGSFGYAGQIKQSPTDEEGGKLKRRWFEVVHGKTWYGKVIRFVMDTAYTEDSDNDPSGFLSYFVENNCCYITNWQSKRLEFPELLVETKTFALNNGYNVKTSSIRVEPKASGKSIVQTIRRETQFNISEDVNPEKDKSARVSDIAATCEAMRVKLLAGPWNQDFLDEICGFPRAAHDEAIDCLVMMVRRELQKPKANGRTNAQKLLNR